VRELASDSKLAALKTCLGEAQFVELKDGRGKLLLFTEHRATLSYVREHLERWGFTTCEIHGGLNPHERQRAQEQFRTTAQVCVATEAAGEGINLQFCHLMINYDMPWNPTRLEQRLGRIHRIGQERDVYALPFRSGHLGLPTLATRGGPGRALVSLVHHNEIPTLLPHALANIVLLRVVDGRDDLRGALPWVRKLLLVDGGEDDVERFAEPTEHLILPLNRERSGAEDQHPLDRFPQLQLLDE